MAKHCIYKSPADLPNEMTVKNFEDALGVSRSMSYKRIQEPDLQIYRAGYSETGIRITKQEFLRFIGYVQLDLDDELANTPLVWTIEDIAKYRQKASATIYEEARRENFPKIPGLGTRIVIGREAYLASIGYGQKQEIDLNSNVIHIDDLFVRRLA
ncbi:hypothetical protein CIG75_12960 [Tumebacillus algifaecis]|uniref:Uncharacterized protein n=1 Tax=Tumebacillus algifaecis TaxID=1214604 RepID=A0A223D298_9BACL|nr:hypothetical protein [Tumebacillus algifaecis]ASS75809.1 hypothetical protein CIG75_12960 [Tumebacillus algifaecis]